MASSASSGTDVSDISVASKILGSQDGILRESGGSPNTYVEDLSFIGKLSMMLQDPIALSFVSWSAKEDSILVFDRLKFASQILPRSRYVYLLCLNFG